MSAMHDDDARPMPQRRGAPGAASRGGSGVGPRGYAARPGARSGAGAGAGAGAGSTTYGEGTADDEVYVVDTRGRRGRPGAAHPQQRATEREPERAVSARPEGAPVRTGTRPMPTTGARAPRDPRDPRDPRPTGPGGPRGPRGPGRPGGPGGPGGSSARPTGPTRPRRRGRRVALLLTLALVAYVVFLGYAPWHAWSSVSRVATDPGGSRPTSAGSNYLLVGSDSRDGLTAAQKKKLHTGTFEGQRTDSIMLVHRSSSGRSVIVSLPRDSYVPIPGYGSNKINAAYAIGGPRLLVATVEQVTGLHVDGYIEVGLGGFANVVDALGGVEICVPFHMDDPKAHINLRKGCQVLDGPNALGYVRARYSDPRGDIGRAQRQRQFLGAVMKKTATPSTVLIPWRWWGTTHAVAQGLRLGEDTTLADAGRIALVMRGVSTDETLSLVVPIESTNYATQAGSSVKWDTTRAQELFRILKADEPLTAPPAGTDGKPTGP